ncbi:unnamed protein product [Rotaria sp. Silwood1]|nr:unnamed protein product [Rotaria sp. Silwood1]CAF1604195.1 unnamed protein product [Rotaria sp. Silwood1]CAF3684567.1 unnamed protein product [Rotaria sp. Silwood1]CAF3684669.1 unnamed protein product [Rotaria sp. Silwood1]CAF3702852.1 unnamed protein product [Rotaria sp. Silwood1]
MSESKDHDEWNPRFIENTCDEPEVALQPLEDYQELELVSLEEAIEPIKSLFRNLPRDVWIAKNASKEPANGLSSDESAAIHLYTMEIKTRSLYSILNEMLRDRDRQKLKPWFPYLKLFMTALFKIQSCSAKVIYRGVKADLHLKFHDGERYIWWAFSSCTLSLKVLQRKMYLGDSGPRTLFNIECLNGKPIKAHSHYKTEDEILLLPGFYFEVVSKVNAGNGLYIIHVREITPPHVLLEPPFSNDLSTAVHQINIESAIPNIPIDTRWSQNGEIVAGGNGKGNATNQLWGPHGLFVDDDQTMIITDYWNHRIVQWKMGDKNGQVVAGGKGKDNRLDQLSLPTDVLIDKETDSFIICDYGNRRVVRWSRRSSTNQGEILIDNIKCFGLFMDDQRYIYVSDTEKHEIRQYQIGDKNGIIVAGGNGKGAGLNQLKFPTYIFVDQQQNVYVSDNENHRVMKWNKGAKEGIFVAGGQGEGDALTQLYFPMGLFVDTLGTIYVADSGNHRIMRWTKKAKQGTIIVGGNGEGAGTNQFNYLASFFFDRQGNFYVADNQNHRVQFFSIQ